MSFTYHMVTGKASASETGEVDACVTSYELSECFM